MESRGGYGATNNCSLNSTQFPWPNDMNHVKYSNGHQLDTIILLKHAERAQDQSSAMGARCLGFLIGESGAAVLLLRGGRFTLTRENLFKEK